jgi:hypothetical protein
MRKTELLTRTLSKEFVLDHGTPEETMVRLEQYAKDVGGFNLVVGETRIEFETMFSFSNWNPFGGLAHAAVEVMGDSPSGCVVRVSLNYGRQVRGHIIISGLGLTMAMPMVAVLVAILAGVRIPMLAAIAAGPLLGALIGLALSPLSTRFLHGLAVAKIRRHLEESSEAPQDETYTGRG